MRENTDQSNSEYGLFLRGDNKIYWQIHVTPLPLGKSCSVSSTGQK